MKKTRKSPRRQVFILTPDEKKTIACVLGAFLLGLGTMHYRAKHPRPPAPPTAAQEKEAKRAAARERSGRAPQRTTRGAEKPSKEPRLNKTDADDGDE
jgi:hypothetical protein